MTSQVTREQVENELWKAGIRSTFTVARVMRAIDLYSLTVARRQSQFTLENPGTPFYWLTPGDWDKNGEVTCCVACGKTKKWAHFHVDETHPSGHKVTCKPCRRKQTENIPGG